MTYNYKNIIAQARKEKPESQKAVNIESNNTGKPESQKMTNLTIKVPLHYRRYWLSKAKGEGGSLTEEIIKALSERFGLPK